MNNVLISLFEKSTNGLEKKPNLAKNQFFPVKKPAGVLSFDLSKWTSAQCTSGEETQACPISISFEL